MQLQEQPHLLVVRGRGDCRGRGGTAERDAPRLKKGHAHPSAIDIGPTIFEASCTAGDASETNRAGVKPLQNSEPTSATLEAALDRFEIALPSDQLRQLAKYCELLWDYNQQLNLTRHCDFDTFVARDLIDSRALSDQLEEGSTVLDVGTGGGVPGLVLAIIRPDLRVSLCDSSGKKAKVVADIVQSLNLSVPVYQERVENVLEVSSFDVLVARAVGPLWKILKWLRPHWDRFDRLLLVKGPRWSEERLEARHRGLLKPLEIRRQLSYTTPGHDGESVILCIRQQAN